ncbi:MAG: hypothetical protein ACYDCQ_14355 [Dehalococcoidia bacterium]
MSLLVGTTNGVFIAHEGGTAPVAGLEERNVRVFARSNRCLLAGADDGVYRSEDAGRSWTRAGADGKAVWDLAVSADDSRTVFAGTEPAALYRSADGGRSWSEIESFRNAPGAERWCVPLKPPRPGRARTVVLDRQNADRWFVGVEVGGVVTSDNAGASWRVDLPGNNPDIHVMANNPAKPSVLFATTGYGRIDGVAEMVEGNAGFFRSDDAGGTWQYKWQGMLPRYTRPMCVDPRSPHALTVSCAPTAFSSFRDEGGAKAMLYRSDDDGETWRSLCDAAHSPSAANFLSVAPAPETAGAVLVGTDTGEVWRVSGEGAWELLLAGLPAVQAVA